MRALLDHLDEASRLAGVLDPARLAADAGLGPDEVRGVLSALAGSGKVGYDWAQPRTSIGSCPTGRSRTHRSTPA